MLKLVMLLTIITLLLEAKTEVVTQDNVYNEVDKKCLKLILSKNNQENRPLFKPENFTSTLNIIKDNDLIYKKFINERNTLKNNGNNKELYNLYVYILKYISKNVLTNSTQLISRNFYEMHILERLKEDFDRGYFLEEEKDLLREDIKKFLLIDKFIIYKMQRQKNILYMQNIKQYFSKKTGIPIQMISDSHIYIMFLKLLNEGEALMLDDIKNNKFEKFIKFIKKIEASPKKIKSLINMKNKNLSMVMEKYINLWISAQVYRRYTLISIDLKDELNMIEKEKIFFEEL